MKRTVSLSDREILLILRSLEEHGDNLDALTNLAGDQFGGNKQVFENDRTATNKLHIKLVKELNRGSE